MDERIDGFVAIFDFVHYTEADQISHMRPRHRHKLYQVLKSSEKGGAWKGGKMSILTPHRLERYTSSAGRGLSAEALTRLRYGSNLPEDVSDEVLRDLESQAAVVRKEEYQLPSAYEPRRDPWHLLVFGTQRGAWVRRELDGYGAKKTLGVGRRVAVRVLLLSAQGRDVVSL